MTGRSFAIPPILAVMLLLAITLRAEAQNPTATAKARVMAPRVVEPLEIRNRYALRRLPGTVHTARASRRLDEADGHREASRDTDLLAPQFTASPPAAEADASNDDDDLLTGDPDAEEDLLQPPAAQEKATEPVAEEEDLLSGPSDEAADESSEKSTDPKKPAEENATDDSKDAKKATDVDPHAELFSKCRYPSAKDCATCHEQIYREWSVSSHAYASISPMFHKFEQRINELAQGTVGHFCLRCHAPVATDMGLPREANLLATIPVAHEGVTCIVCHRVVERYGRVNGERRIEFGSVYDPVVGAGDGGALQQVLEHKDHFKVKTSPDEKGPGSPIHNRVIQFEQVSSSHFCVSCHQVAVYPGIKLEVVWEQYRASPACKSGVRCQDCHMGVVPGQPAGFERGPAAIIAGKPVNPNRRHSNHMFVGPGYSIAHPGIFPFHPKADRWTWEEWLQFDWRAGWGTDAFEERLEKDATAKSKACFPEVWKNVDDRYDAREILDKNLELLAEKTEQRRLLMEYATRIEGPFFLHPPQVGHRLKFNYRLVSQNSGHNTPSGSLGAQPQLWLNVALSGPDGQTIWESGNVDANGDMADLHSLEVAAGRIDRDTQLVNLQTKFLITHVKGTDREMYLPINIDIDQLPFIRPSGFPITTLNHPPFIRMEAHSLPPLGARTAKYHVPAECIQRPGRYRLTVRMRSRAEPIYFMRFCRATPDMERSMNENMLDFHQHSYEFTIR